MQELNIVLVFLAGIASVMSPCVFPVVPIVVSGSKTDHKFRPLLVVGGLSASFILMGVLTSLFGSVIGPQMFYIEKAVGVLVVVFGVLLIINVNLFKRLSFLSSFAQKSRGRVGGLFLGFILGIVWIPCIGPMLSGVLSLVATQGRIMNGVFYLLVYSAGFSVPLLIGGYASQFFRQKLGSVKRLPGIVNIVSGLILISLGIFIITKGITAMNF
ncbi:MAG: cytochrome c biogenesis CcdA family protein [Chitinispirillaceae bacterium]